MRPEYDLWLVALSVVIAIFASFTALGIASRIPRIPSAKLGRWLAGGAIAMGSGIWSMHFVGMLAFHLPIPLAYDIPLTLLSLATGIGASGLALWLIRRGAKTQGQIHLSALLMALGICAMHYIGMAALKMSPGIDYNPALMFASFGIAYTAAWFAIMVAFLSGNEAPRPFATKYLLAAGYLGTAITGMHYVGMAAANFAPGSVCLAAPQGLDAGQLAVVVTSLTFMILLATLMLLAYDLRMDEQRARLLVELERRNAELEAQARAQALAMIEQVREGAKRDHMLATVVQQSGDAILTLDLEGRISSWNRAAERLFGYSADAAIGQGLELLDPTSPMAVFCEPGGLSRAETDNLMHLRTQSGRPLIANFSRTDLCDEHGAQIGETLILRDVTEEKLNRDQLQLMGLVIENVGEGIVITDADNRIISVNKAFSTITGYAAEEVLGRDPKVLASGKHESGFYTQMWQALMGPGHWKGEIWNRRKDGGLYPEWASISVLRDIQGNVCNHIAVFTDISSFKEKEARIEYLAHHDHLTQLPNRLLLNDRIDLAIARAQREGTKTAVLFLDLDRFKLVNDTLGHAVGDLLLQEVARRLKGMVRGEDTVSRQGGDEFVILIQGIRNIAHIAHLAEKFLEALSADYLIEGESLRVTPSIGISLYPDDAETATELIKHADTAMYHAKESGRATYQFYTEQLNAALAERLALENALRTALQRNEFQLHLQPQYRIHDGKMVGAEVLLRWFHPERGAIGPDRFIPVAEDANLIEAIGLWVLEESIKLLHAWRDGPMGQLPLSVNVSPRQLNNPAFATQVRQLLQRHAITPALLQLEITETALMQNVDRCVLHLEELRRIGVRIAVDDFGTGYSSLSYLKRLPIHELKIDRSFIRDIPDDHQDEAVCRAIINLAHTLQYKVVGEGVETASQLEFLRAAGCDIIQGFHYARPMPIASFMERAQADMAGAA